MPKGYSKRSTPKTYSTPQAAKLIGVSLVTAYRWLAAKKIRPYGIVLGDERKVWRWNDRDITEGRKLKASQKHGPRAKRLIGA
jgi:excisionase family DNA binding protein